MIDKCFMEINVKYSKELKKLITSQERVATNYVYSCFVTKDIACLKKYLCKVKGKCLTLSMYLYSILVKTYLSKYSIYVVIIKPRIKSLMDHHAVVAILTPDNEVIIIDPMQLCVGKLPWNWYMNLKNLLEIENIMGHVVLIFNDKIGFINTC